MPHSIGPIIEAATSELATASEHLALSGLEYYGDALLNYQHNLPGGSLLHHIFSYTCPTLDDVANSNSSRLMNRRGRSALASQFGKENLTIWEVDLLTKLKREAQAKIQGIRDKNNKLVESQRASSQDSSESAAGGQQTGTAEFSDEVPNPNVVIAGFRSLISFLGKFLGMLRSIISGTTDMIHLLFSGMFKVASTLLSYGLWSIQTVLYYSYMIVETVMSWTFDCVMVISGCLASALSWGGGMSAAFLRGASDYLEQISAALPGLVESARESVPNGARFTRDQIIDAYGQFSNSTSSTLDTVKPIFYQAANVAESANKFFLEMIKSATFDEAMVTAENAHSFNTDEDNTFILKFTMALLKFTKHTQERDEFDDIVSTLSDYLQSSKESSIPTHIRHQIQQILSSSDEKALMSFDEDGYTFHREAYFPDSKDEAEESASWSWL